MRQQSLVREGKIASGWVGVLWRTDVQVCFRLGLGMGMATGDGRVSSTPTRTMKSQHGGNPPFLDTAKKGWSGNAGR